MLVDLRSDTLTKPSPGMLDAMINATVGDDVFNVDPTVNELETKAAAMFGMESGLFCPSGTMTNQIAIKSHTNPLDEILCDELSHIYNYETGGFAFNSGVSIKLLKGDRGRFSSKDILENIQPDFDWLPNTSLVSIENTCNKGGGCFFTIKQMQILSETCKHAKLKFHLDGARIFNALLELKKKPLDLKGYFDSISICISKGLGAPAGSVLLGSKEFIKRSRKFRKVMGGGMRQAGYLAAACIYALENNVERLSEDHKKAKVLAEELSQVPFIKSIDPVDTNIIMFHLNDLITVEKFISVLNNFEINAIPLGAQSVRMVTHLDFTDEMLERTIKVLRKLR